MKIRRAALLVSGATSHTFVETYVDGQLFDTTLCSAPEWNRALSVRLMYLQPALKISFLLYMKRLLPNLLLSGSSASSTASADVKGAVHIDLGTLIPSLNSPPRDMEFELLSRESGRPAAHLTVGVELRETRLFSVVSAQSSAFKDLRAVTEKALSPALSRKIAALDNVRRSLMNNVTKLLLESAALLCEADVDCLLTDLLLLLNDPSAALSPTTAAARAASAPMALVMRQLAEERDSLCYYPCAAHRYLSSGCFSPRSWAAEGGGVLQQHVQHNRTVYAAQQPVCSSLYNLATVCGFPRRPFKGYDLSVLQLDGTEYFLRFADYRDYICVLRELSHSSYGHVYSYASNGSSSTRRVTSHSCSAAYWSDAVQAARTVSVTVDSGDSQRCMHISAVGGDLQLMVPFEDVRVAMHF